MERSIRVVVANRPRLMRDLVMATIRDQPDIEIVAEVQNEADIAGVVEEKQPQFLIIALDEPGKRPALCDDLLKRYPDMKVLALAPEENIGMCFWTSRDIRADRMEASEQALLDALRA